MFGRPVGWCVKSGNRPRLYRRGGGRGGRISSRPKRGVQDTSVDIQELGNDRRLGTSAAACPAAMQAGLAVRAAPIFNISKRSRWWDVIQREGWKV